MCVCVFELFYLGVWLVFSFLGARSRILGGFMMYWADFS